jgi:hypothetical protein
MVALTVQARSQELVDSSQLVGDGAALRSRIATDGYVFVRGLLDPRWVREVGAAGLGALQRNGWMESVHAVKMRDAFGDRGYQALLADPALNSIPYVSPLASLMAQLLGPLGFCYPLKIPRVVYPSSQVPHQPGNYVHKDYGTVQDMFTSWVPLGDVPASLGGLAVQPGSQTTSRVLPRPLDGLKSGWRTTDYQAGDVIVFHCLTTHAALPNREERMRLSAEFRWQLADQPAPRRLVLGPGGREIGSRLFGRTSWWKPVPPGLTLFDGGGVDTQARYPVPPSRFLP